MHPILERLFEHNRWANLALVEVCLAVDEGALETAVAGTFGSVKATLTHIAGAEQRYLLALQAKDRHAVPRLEDVNPSVADIRDSLDHSGAGLIEVARGLDDDPSLAVAWQGQTYELPASLFLVQAINHATEHRAQIMTTLTQAGVQPPELDGWTFYGVG